MLTEIIDFNAILKVFSVFEKLKRIKIMRIYFSIYVR